MTSSLAPPRRITVANAAPPLDTSPTIHAEPGVDIIVDSLEGEVLPGGTLKRSAVATHDRIPTSNDEP